MLKNLMEHLGTMWKLKDWIFSLKDWIPNGMFLLSLWTAEMCWLSNNVKFVEL